MSGGSVCPWRTEGNERSGASAPASGITIERHGTWLYGSSHDGGGTQGWPNPDQKERPVLLPAFSVGLEQRLHSLLAWISQTRTYQGGEPGRHLHFSGTQDLVCW